MFGLIPKNEKFFVLFKEMAANITQGAKLFKEMLDTFDDPVMSQKKIKEIEHRGDSQTHEIVKKFKDLDGQSLYGIGHLSIIPFWFWQPMTEPKIFLGRYV